MGMIVTIVVVIWEHSRHSTHVRGQRTTSGVSSLPLLLWVLGLNPSSSGLDSKHRLSHLASSLLDLFKGVWAVAGVRWGLLCIAQATLELVTPCLSLLSAGILSYRCVPPHLYVFSVSLCVGQLDGVGPLLPPWSGSWGDSGQQMPGKCPSPVEPTYCPSFISFYGMVAN